jgi:hypothetical protein
MYWVDLFRERKRAMYWVDPFRKHSGNLAPSFLRHNKKSLLSPRFSEKSGKNCPDNRKFWEVGEFAPQTKSKKLDYAKTNQRR